MRSSAPRRAFLYTAMLAMAGMLSAAALEDDAGVDEDPTLMERLNGVLEEVRNGESSIDFGSLTTIEAYIKDMKRAGSRDPEYIERMTGQVEELLDDAEEGEDTLSARRGFFWRGYRSRFSSRPQLYSIYVPEEYDPEEKMPLVVSLHGGSSNHNVWLALNLGNKISVADYWASHRKEFPARRHPDAIVVAPDGLGQIRWRWAGEQDVLDVIDDVRINYNIDRDKIFLTGLSNGGIGAYTIGLKHAHAFASVLPLAGVTDWLSHHEADGRLRSCERTVLRNESAITYAENAFNTFLRFFHGEKDPGFSVEQARKMDSVLNKLRIPHRYHEFKNQGHDLGYVLWRKLLIDRYVREYERDPAPREIRLVTASARANSQSWLILDDRIDHLRPARLHAWITYTGAVRVETENAARFSILLDQSPISSPVNVFVDSQPVYCGPIPPNNRLTLVSSLAPVRTFEEGMPVSQPMWEQWDGASPAPGTVKVDGLSGPMGDANYEPQVHVYGTMIEDEVATLKKAARLGARGWMMAWDYTEIRHPVIPDTDLTWEMMRNNTVVLYGNAKSNSILARIGDRLPIQVVGKHMIMRGEKVSGWGVGARFICPNPLAPQRYLVVATGTSARAVEEGGKLPIYLADYIVYHHLTTKRKAFMILGSRKEIETGFFTEDWKLPERPPDR